MVKLNIDAKRHMLKNKLEVITVCKDTQISSINAGIKVGALYENIEEKGISHFIEHALFKGTYKRNNEKLNSDLENLGGEYNAYTDYTATVYTITCLQEEFENAAEILSDMLLNPSFEKEELEKERGVILSEIKMGKDDLEDFSFKCVNEAAYNKSGLKYEVTGLEENVKKFTPDDLRKFYKKYYVPENTIITIVSPLSHKEAVELAEKYFGGWKGEKPEKTAFIKEVNKPVIKESTRKDIEQCTIIYLYTFYDIIKEDELPIRILNHRLGESANSLLFREIREKRGLAYDIYTHLEITNDIKNLYIFTSVSEENIEETKNAIDETLKKVVNGKIKIDEKDLSIMKKVHKMAVISTLEDSAELCGYMLNQALENEDIYEFLEDIKKLNNIDIKKINEAGRKILKNPTVHILRCAD